MGSVKWDMVNPEMIMIGTDDGSKTGDAKELIDFYKPMMQNKPRYIVGTWDECEAIKIFYNTAVLNINSLYKIQLFKNTLDDQHKKFEILKINEANYKC